MPVNCPKRRLRRLSWLPHTPSVIRRWRTVLSGLAILAVLSRTYLALSDHGRLRGLPAPDDDVCVCTNYQTCKTPPVFADDVDPEHPPLCGEGQRMTTIISYNEWPHG